MSHKPSVFRSGFVAIIGRPNAGKSTLLNTLVGAKVAIVTEKPQTTRNRILGIVHRRGAQIVLMDTPGIHKPLSKLNRRMMTHVYDALQDKDLVLLIVDAAQPFGRGDQFVLDLLMRTRGKKILLLNKVDLIQKTKLLPLMGRYSNAVPFEETFPISALHGEGLEEVLDAVAATLPEGPQYFPEDMHTDQPERFLACEIIREKLIHFTEKELPYATAVLMDKFEESKSITRIYATIVVERSTQKAIVIGQKGQRLKKIGTMARRELEKIFPPKVYLELFVKVTPRWRDNAQMVKSLDVHDSTS